MAIVQITYGNEALAEVQTPYYFMQSAGVSKIYSVIDNDLNVTSIKTCDIDKSSIETSTRKLQTNHMHIVANYMSKPQPISYKTFFELIDQKLLTLHKKLVSVKYQQLQSVRKQSPSERLPVLKFLLRTY